MPASTLRDVTALCPRRPRSPREPRLRLVNVFRQGWVALLVALLRYESELLYAGTVARGASLGGRDP